MAATTVSTLAMGSNFPAELTKELMSKVVGKSSLAKLSASNPIAFTGNQEMVFNMPNEIDVVGENSTKSHGGIEVEPVTIIPIKFEYGARVSDEFMYAAEEKQLDILGTFTDGFAKKVARGLDIAAMHGVNPRSGETSTIINGNSFDDMVSATVSYDSSAPDDNLEDAISTVTSNDAEVTGIAISPTFGTALGQMKGNSGYYYPEFKFGQIPSELGGSVIDSNTTVSYGTVDQAIVGDFENAFKWGYAKDIPLEVIPYGDPDNSGVDLKGSNQVYIRSEVYLGWGILNADAFARIINATA